MKEVETRDWAVGGSSHVWTWFLVVIRTMGGDLSGAHLLANPRGLCAFMKGKGLHLCGGQRRIEGREGVRIDRDSSIFRGGQRIFLELRMFCR